MKKRHLKKEPIYTFIFLVSVLFIYTFNVTSSRYLGEISSDSEVLAVPRISLNETEATYDLTNMIPGDVRELEFLVTNEEDSQINEVLLSYDLEFVIEGNLPLTFKLFDENNEEISLLNNKTSEQQIGFGSLVSRKYKLQVIWDRSKNSNEYVNQTGKLQINLRTI